ncbi:restriction endonuclease subunit S [Algoriphagus mannitolivorans]|uniref:restriction endonuclease subunit S n=1 Tax=Algoriphagus mannitolivorans TaxID=226504 RepID=UPI000479F37D|nr:restriction endonuclease subunit S [Algoriphagus mannitolivorans]
MKQNWEIKKLGEVSDVGAGNSAPQKKELFDNGKFPFFRTSDVGQIRKGFIERSVDYLNDKGIKGLKLFQKGTILFPKSGASTFLNHRVMMNVDGYVSSHLATIKAKSKIADDRYLLYYLITIDAKDLMQDIAYPSLKTSDIGLIPIPLPPLPEQQRIVSILDEAFAAIAKAKANAEQNLQNSKELFESYLQGVFEQKGEGWKKTSLKNEIELLSGFAFKSKFYSERNEDILLVRGDNIMQGYFRWEDAKRWNSDEFEEYKRFQLFENDVVLAMDRPWVKAGLKCAMISKNEIPSLLVQRTASLRCKKDLDSSFLFYLVKSVAFTRHLLGVQTGIGVPHISGKQILDFSFYKPELKEQQIIVRQLDALRAETQKLEAVYQKKIEDLEELKKSILQKAFAGELTCKGVEV